MYNCFVVTDEVFLMFKIVENPPRRSLRIQGYDDA